MLKIIGYLVDWWSFGNGTARNVILFGGNFKNRFLTLDKGPTFGINGSFGEPEKKFSISFTKTNTKFCLSLHYNGGKSYLFVDGKNIIKFKTDNKNVTFPTRFC